MQPLRNAIAFLPAALVVADFFAARWAADYPLEVHPAKVLLLGLVTSQCALLAVWAALGRTIGPVRIPLALLGLALPIMALAHAAGVSDCEPSTSVVLAVLAAAVPVLALTLFLLRRWNIRLAMPDATGTVPRPHRPVQFTTQHLLMAVSGVTVLFALLNWLSNRHVPVWYTTFVSATALLALATLGTVWATLGVRGWRLRVLLPLGMVPAGALGIVWIAGGATFTLPNAWQLAAAGVAALHVLVLALVLLLVRRCGYRLARAESAPIAPTVHPRLYTPVLATLFAAAFTLLPATYRTWQQHQAVAAIAAAGGSVSRHNGKLVYVSLGRSDKATDALLRHVACLSDLKELDLNATSITDDGLAHLQSLKRLERLALDGTKVTNAGMRHLAALPSLKDLTVYGTTVTVAGVAPLQSLRPKLAVTGAESLAEPDRSAVDAIRRLGGAVNLFATSQVRAVFLGGPNASKMLEYVGRLTSIDSLECSGPVTDDALRHIKHQKSLRYLELKGTRVTDAGMQQLENLGNLETLYLSGTTVTDRGVQSLQRALPHLVVVHR